MHIHVNGKNIEITDAIKSYVKEKIGKVAARYDQIQGIDVVLTVIKNPAKRGQTYCRSYMQNKFRHNSLRRSRRINVCKHRFVGR